MECYNTSITAVGSLIKNSVSRRLWVFHVPVWKCGKISLSCSLSLERSHSLAESFFVHLNSGWRSVPEMCMVLIQQSCNLCTMTVNLGRWFLTAVTGIPNEQLHKLYFCFCFPSHGFPFRTSNLAIIANLKRSIISGESDLNGSGSTGAWLDVNGTYSFLSQSQEL